MIQYHYGMNFTNKQISQTSSYVFLVQSETNRNFSCFMGTVLLKMEMYCIALRCVIKHFVS